MTDVSRLLEEFIADDRAGGLADPAAYLARASAPDRAELEALIDGYLARAPRRAFDAAAFEASPAARVVASLAGSSGTWPSLLPRLRDRARLKRAELVARLAADLGVGGREAKVASYYHAMEQGTLASSGVSDRVLEALGRIVGESAAVLRAAGTLAPPPPPAPGAAFARVAAPAPAFRAAGGEPMRARAEAAESERDEVDELFTGGA
ncbi:hypothetical protein OM076_40225 [Solirubrobacter ginsenosidimutans]|uniref:Uncharacterized protein n=1 Tax=Solirubrobacter ginsenosidimutans TaxID=490573 RepID=A0A9X3S4C9_9ACTN|nr:hypothetical protein [Solirubrobacter ginsenosidimutans]MDA0166560.1 hypothetical protein [Solirubrobacter ginsenosidimutans]